MKLTKPAIAFILGFATNLNIIRPCHGVDGESDPMWNEGDDFFDGDIKKEWYSFANTFGEEVALKLGLTPPEDDKGRGSSDYWSLWKTDWMSGTERWRINYYIDPSFSAEDVKTIKVALRKLKNKTGAIAFKQRNVKPTTGMPYINIQKLGGCWSYIGMTSSATQPNGQDMSLGSGCVSTRIVQHEFLHALGFYHEQSRPDRDNYVTINWGNIQDGKEGNFEKSSVINSMGTTYDYKSVMHYGEYAFSVDYGNLKTVDARGNSVGGNGISGMDKKQIKMMYQCDPSRTTVRSEAELASDGLCTTECKCGKKQAGCQVDDSVCKGSLTCVDNRCK